MFINICCWWHLIHILSVIWIFINNINIITISIKSFSFDANIGMYHWLYVMNWCIMLHIIMVNMCILCFYVSMYNVSMNCMHRISVNHLYIIIIVFVIDIMWYVIVIVVYQCWFMFIIYWLYPACIVWLQWYTLQYTHRSIKTTSLHYINIPSIITINHRTIYMNILILYWYILPHIISIFINNNTCIYLFIDVCCFRTLILFIIIYIYIWIYIHIHAIIVKSEWL